MLSNDYSRLHAACLVMARQPNLPGVQARWLVMAETSLDLANIVDKKRRRSCKVNSAETYTELEFRRPLTTRAPKMLFAQ